LVLARFRRKFMDRRDEVRRRRSLPPLEDVCLPSDVLQSTPNVKFHVISVELSLLSFNDL
jgi:hypothetical protein